MFLPQIEQMGSADGKTSKRVVITDSGVLQVRRRRMNFGRQCNYLCILKVIFSSILWQLLFRECMGGGGGGGIFKGEREIFFGNFALKKKGSEFF